MPARKHILARLRGGGATPLAAPVLTAEATRTLAEPHHLQSLRDNLAAAHAEIIDADSASWRDALAELCARKNIRTLMLPPHGIDLDEWTGGPRIRRFDAPMESLKDALFSEVDAGLTVAECAIADTGMLVLASSPRQPRSLSLVPPINICLLDTSRLHADMSSALRAENWAAAMPANLIFISGPSKTADIQQTLAYGAHGPRELIVILIQEWTR